VLKGDESKKATLLEYLMMLGLLCCFSKGADSNNGACGPGAGKSGEGGIGPEGEEAAWGGVGARGSGDSAAGGDQGA
jgi:hypothetical protein